MWYNVMHYKTFVFDTCLVESGSSQDIRVPPKFFTLTGLKKNSKKKLRVTIQVLILLIALGSMTLGQEEKQTTGIGSLITTIEATNIRITALQKQFTADITDLNEALSGKIDGLFSRIVIAVIGVHFFILGSSKAIGGLAKYIRGKKQLKAVQKNNQLLEEIIPLLKTLNTTQAVKEAKELEAKKPKKKVALVSLRNVIIAGVITALTIIVLYKAGVIV